MRKLRILIYEGDEEWINSTLRRSYVQEKVQIGLATITSILVKGEDMPILVGDEKPLERGEKTIAGKEG